jgi:hypothetical protein
MEYISERSPVLRRIFGNKGDEETEAAEFSKFGVSHTVLSHEILLE